MNRRIVSIVFLLFSIVSYHNLFSQNTTFRFSDQAESLFASGEYSKVIPYANSNIKNLLDKPDIDSLEISKLYMHLTASYYKLRENEKSIEISKKAFGYCPNNDEGKNVEARILYWRSFPEYFLNKPYASYESKKRAVEILKSTENPDLEFLTGAYAELSLDMAFMGYLNKASKYIESAIETNKIKNETAKKNNYYSLDEDLELWLQFKKAQVINKKIDLEFTKENQQEIKKTIQKYKDFRKQNPNYWPANKRIMSGIIYSYYGNSFLTNSELYRYPDSALYYYDKATQQFNKEDNPYQYNLVLYNKSRAHREKGDYNKALEIIEELILDDKNPNSSSYSSYKTELLLKLNRLEEWKSLVYASVSRIHNSTDTLKADFSNFVPSTSITQTDDILSLAESIENENLDKLYFKDLKTKLYQIATEQFKASYRFSTFNQRLKNYYKRVLIGNIEMITDSTSYDPEAISRLLNDTENIENRLAWQKFSKSRQMVDMPKIDSIEEVEFKIRQELVDAKQNKISRKIDSLEEKLAQHNNRIEKNYPRYSGFINENFDIKKIQSKIPEDEVILKYSFFEDRFVIFEISTNDIKLHLNDWNAKEKKSLQDHNNLVKNTKLTPEKNEKLSNVLLTIDISDYDKITIIADKPINQLPFETLFYNNKYLVESKSIRYSSHLRFIFLDEINNEKDTDNPIVNIFAPDYPGESVASATRSGLYYLEGAQKEAEAIKNNFDSKAYIGEEATKNEFIKHKSDGAILHLAMHASMNQINPELSHFNFPNDEKLHIEELYALKLPLDLAVLAACNTAIGNEDNSLNINSLHRAFNYAGTKATIASLWEVPDETTSKIMISFYEYLKEGETKSKALQKAKTDYIENTDVEKLKHPYYWAGFVLYGDDSNVIEASNDWLWFILGFILVFIFLIGYQKKMKN